DAGRMRGIRSADVDLVPGLREHLKSARSQYSLNARVVRSPPVGAVSGKLVFKERHRGPAWVEQGRSIVDFEPCRLGVYLEGRHRERLKQQKLADPPAD